MNWSDDSTLLTLVYDLSPVYMEKIASIVFHNTERYDIPYHILDFSDDTCTFDL